MRAMRLLIAEDDADLRQVLSELLQQSGYSVDECTDGTAALAALLTGQYALGIVDIGLPGLSGLELVRALRNRGGSAPILIVTARDALNDRVSGLDAGADDYLVKPFDLPELQARVRALLRRHEARTAREQPQARQVGDGIDRRARARLQVLPRAELPIDHDTGQRCRRRHARLRPRAARQQGVDLRLALPQYAQTVTRGRRCGLRARQFALSLLPVLERRTVDLIGGMPALLVGQRQFQLCVRGQQIALALCVFGRIELEQRLSLPQQRSQWCDHARHPA